MGIISWYSTGVWKFIDDYFRNEYKAYLSKEFIRNKHLQLKLDVPVEVPKTAAAEDVGFIKNPFINHNRREETCQADLCRSQKKMDYRHYQETNDQQRKDDVGFVSCWPEREGRDNSDYNLHCREKEANCEDN